MNTHIIVESPISDSPRVQQVRGLFDLDAEQVSRVEWTVALPLEDRPWHIGLIVGPSGCGKSTIARGLFPEMAERDEHGRPPQFRDWLGRGAVIDAFPETLP